MVRGLRLSLVLCLVVEIWMWVEVVLLTPLASPGAGSTCHSLCSPSSSSLPAPRLPVACQHSAAARALQPVPSRGPLAGRRRSSLLRPELDELGRRRSSLLRAELRRRCSSLLRWELDELGRRRPSFLGTEPVLAPPSPSRSRTEDDAVQVGRGGPLDLGGPLRPGSERDIPSWG